MGSVVITLTKDEAASFMKWREHQDAFELLLSHNIFDIKNGSAELHFNSVGHIASIDAHVKLFRRPQTGTTSLTAIVLPSQ